MKFRCLLFAAFLLAACGDDSSSASANDNPESSSSSVKDAGSVYDVTAQTVKDLRDGQTYKTVTIGTQTWMAENLNYAYKGVKYNYNDYTSDSSSWCYVNYASDCDKYGRLYTWAAAMDSAGLVDPAGAGVGCGYGGTCSAGGTVRGICPEGWHLPTKSEWETLFTVVGGISKAGDMLKSTSGWNSGGNGIDEYEFSVLPAGFMGYDGAFFLEGYYVHFWSSTGYNGNRAWGMFFYYDSSNVDENNYYKDCGFSVRCLKDDPGSSAKSSSSVASSSSAKSSSSVASSSSISYGMVTDDRDGQTYKTVTVGTQTWMAENLNYAYKGVKYYYSGYTSDSTGWCYDNKSSNCEKYGRLYTWAAAMDSAGLVDPAGAGVGCGYRKTCSAGGTVRGICPEGWHLPTKAEWETLFTAVGGTSKAGDMLKSTSGWYSGGNGIDEYEFSVLPAGYRDNDGDFNDEGYYAYFWSSTEVSGSYAWYMNFGCSYSDVYEHDSNKDNGFIVRCLKDDP